jgi:hypothetical protein
MRPCKRQVLPVQQDCLVSREESAVVLQDAQSVTHDLGVGGVDIDDIHLSACQCFVGQAMVQAAHLRGRQLVRLAECRPTVLAIQEFLRQRHGEPGMPRKVGNTRDAKRPRPALLHRERIAVAEPERHARREPVTFELAIELGEIRHAFQPQQLKGDCAGVLRVELDSTALQRGEQDRSVAETLLVRGASLAGTVDRLGGDLGQDIGLGEALGAHVDDGLGEPKRRQQQQYQETQHRGAYRCVQYG